MSSVSATVTSTDDRHVRVASFSEIAPSSAIRVDVTATDGSAHRVAIVRIGDDLYAIGDRCSHADVSLSEGSVWDDTCEIECIKHGSSFSLRTGRPSTLPATKPVPVYAIHRHDDDVFVDLVPESDNDGGAQ